MYTHNYSRLLFNLIHTKKSFIMHVNFALIFSTFCHLGIKETVFLPFILLKTGITPYHVVFLEIRALYGARPLYSKNSRNNQIQPYFEQSYLIVKSKYVPFAPNIHTLYLLPAESFPFISTEDFSSQENRLLVTVTVFQPI